MKEGLKRTTGKTKDARGMEFDYIRTCIVDEIWIEEKKDWEYKESEIRYIDKLFGNISNTLNELKIIMGNTG